VCVCVCVCVCVPVRERESGAKWGTESYAMKLKGWKEGLFIRAETHDLRIFGVIPFVKLRNDT